MNPTAEGGILGVVGGLGPWASAEFLKTIYEDCLDGCEQDSPRVIMYSDRPSRTGPAPSSPVTPAPCCVN